MRLKTFLQSRVARWLTVFGVVVLAACATLLGPRTIDVPQTRLDALLAEHFPIDKRIFDVIDVHIPTPHLTMRPQINRVAIEVVILQGRSSNVVVDGERPDRFGSILVTSGVRFEPTDATLRLFDVRVEQLAFVGVGALLNGQAERAGRRLAEGMLENQPIYTLRPNDVAGLEAHGYRPGDIRVTASGLAVTLIPNDK